MNVSTNVVSYIDSVYNCSFIQKHNTEHLFDKFTHLTFSFDFSDTPAGIEFFIASAHQIMRHIQEHSECVTQAWSQGSVVIWRWSNQCGLEYVN